MLSIDIIFTVDTDTVLLFSRDKGTALYAISRIYITFARYYRYLLAFVAYSTFKWLETDSIMPFEYCSEEALRRGGEKDFFRCFP